MHLSKKYLIFFTKISDFKQLEFRNNLVKPDQSICNGSHFLFAESMLYLDGRRRFLEYKRINKITDTSRVEIS